MPVPSALPLTPWVKRHIHLLLLEQTFGASSQDALCKISYFSIFFLSLKAWRQLFVSGQHSVEESIVQWLLSHRACIGMGWGEMVGKDPQWRHSLCPGLLPHPLCVLLITNRTQREKPLIWTPHACHFNWIWRPVTYPHSWGWWSQCFRLSKARLTSQARYSAVFLLTATASDDDDEGLESLKLVISEFASYPSTEQHSLYLLEQDI